MMNHSQHHHAGCILPACRIDPLLYLSQKRPATLHANQHAIAFHRGGIHLFAAAFACTILDLHQRAA